MAAIRLRKGKWLVQVRRQGCTELMGSTGRPLHHLKGRQTKTLVGQVLRENTHMLHFVEHLGFHRTGIPEQGVVEVTLDLTKSKEN